jgi:hypothetical protein
VWGTPSSEPQQLVQRGELKGQPRGRAEAGVVWLRGSSSGARQWQELIEVVAQHQEATKLHCEILLILVIGSIWLEMW